MARGTLCLLLGCFLIGCKTRKRVSDNQRDIRHVQAQPTETKRPEASQGTTYTLPEDTGQFVRFEIGSLAEYIETFSEIAQFEMKAYGIPASITLAQGLLESGFGNGPLAKKTNNHFGIKCHTGWQGDYDFHDDDEKGECFRKYNHPMYSFRDHSIFLSGRSRYAFLFDLPIDDYKAWARGLRKAGYATDKRYPEKLISLIETHGLHRYDREVARQGYGRGDRRSEPVAVAMTPEHQVHVVRQGDTLYSLSRRYEVSIDELKRWNYMSNNDLSIGQKLTVKTASFN